MLTTHSLSVWIALAATVVFGDFQVPSLKDVGLMSLGGVLFFCGNGFIILACKASNLYAYGYF